MLVLPATQLLCLLLTATNPSNASCIMVAVRDSPYVFFMLTVNIQYHLWFHVASTEKDNILQWYF